MNVIVCIDDAGGMLFNQRRLSKDRVLREQARKLAQGQALWMNSYTASQFAEDGCAVVTDEAFLVHAPADAWCFVENNDLGPFLHQIGQLAVYRWNRRYPSDVKFPITYFEENWKCVSREEFAGSSHERITQEVYIR